jgi:hypothetical protein
MSDCSFTASCCSTAARGLIADLNTLLAADQVVLLPHTYVSELVYRLCARWTGSKAGSQTPSG